MPRIPAMLRLVPASGGFNAGNVVKVIRLAKHGCTNRPFYHMVVAARKRERDDHCIEQVGSYDPIPNERNEILVAVNYERISHWLGHGVGTTKAVNQLLGISGYFPIHPRTYMEAWRRRKSAVEKAAAGEQEVKAEKEAQVEN